MFDLGRVIKSVVKAPLIPLGIAADVLTFGMEKSNDGKFFTEKAVDEVLKDEG